MLSKKTLTYPFNSPPDLGVLQEVKPGIFWLRMPLPFALDHINLWLIGDGDGWVIVDTGIGYEISRDIWTNILADLNGPVTKIIVTHFHPDHIGLASWLQEKLNVPLLMSAAEYLSAHHVWNQTGGLNVDAMIEQFRMHGMSEEALAQFESRRGGYRRSVPDLPKQFCRIKDQQMIPIGAYRWQVICGYGHSPEHVSLYCEEQGVFISGDMLLPRISTNISAHAVNDFDNLLGDFLDSLNRFSALLSKDTLVLPSHGLPFVGVQQRVEALHEHHKDHLEKIWFACDTPQYAANLIRTLFPRELDSFQTMFAFGEVIAHLNFLEHSGELIRTYAQDGQTCQFIRHPLSKYLASAA